MSGQRRRAPRSFRVVERESGQKATRAKRVANTRRRSPQAKVATLIARLDAAYPDAQCALYYETPYQLLMSVVLSAQANDRIVNRCMRPHYELGLDLTTVLQWGYARLLRNIKQIGLAPTKAKNIMALSKILLDQHDGQIPNDRQALEALPGVGRKTANVILGELFQQQVLAVDTHVFRTTARSACTRRAQPALTGTVCEQQLLTVIDRHHLPHAHHLFIAHGRNTCHARRPACGDCTLNDLCPYEHKQQ